MASYILSLIVTNQYLYHPSNRICCIIFSSLWQNLSYISSPHSVRIYGTFLLLTPTESIVHFFSSLRQNLSYISSHSDIIYRTFLLTPSESMYNSSPHSSRIYRICLLLTPAESIAYVFSSLRQNLLHIFSSHSDRISGTFFLLTPAESIAYVFSSLRHNLSHMSSPHSGRIYRICLLTPAESIAHFFSSFRQNLWYIFSPHSGRIYRICLPFTPTDSVVRFFSSHWPNQSHIHYSYDRIYRTSILLITTESNYIISPPHSITFCYTNFIVTETSSIVILVHFMTEPVVQYFFPPT
jgi:hypothetical protein